MENKTIQTGTEVSNPIATRIAISLGAAESLLPAVSIGNGQPTLKLCVARLVYGAAQDMLCLYADSLDALPSRESHRYLDYLCEQMAPLKDIATDGATRLLKFWSLSRLVRLLQKISRDIPVLEVPGIDRVSFECVAW